MKCRKTNSELFFSTVIEKSTQQSVFSPAIACVFVCEGCIQVQHIKIQKKSKSKFLPSLFHTLLGHALVPPARQTDKQ